MDWRPSGTRSLRARRATATDLAPLVSFVDRCSAETLYRRFHGAAEHAVRRELERITAPSALHRSWVAVDGDEVVRGTATLAWDIGGRPEVAFLVEDAWFRRGVGRTLFGALASEARACELETVLASIQADNRRAVRFLTAVAPDARLAFVDGLLEVTIPVNHRPTGPTVAPRPHRTAGVAG